MAVQIMVRYSGPLIQITRRRREAVVLPEQATLVELIRHLGRTHGQPFLRLFFRDGSRFEPEFVVIRNGAVFEDYQGALCDQDEIALVALFAGGSA